MKVLNLKKSALAAAAAVIAYGGFAAAPALAGGPHGYYGKQYGKSWRHGYYKPARHHSNYRHHYRHRRGGLSGGETALIAAGIIGGAVLISGAMNSNNRYDDRYNDGYNGRGYEPRYAPPPPRDLYYRRDDRGYAPAPSHDRYDDYSGGYGDPYEDRYEGRYDDELLGGGPAPSAGPLPSSGEARADYNYGAAYNDCKAETRAAAGDGGMLVALPARPADITPLDGGDAVRFTTEIMASDLQGREYRRTMICEADLSGVRFLELV